MYVIFEVLFLVVNYCFMLCVCENGLNVLKVEWFGMFMLYGVIDDEMIWLFCGIYEDGFVELVKCFVVV